MLLLFLSVSGPAFAGGADLHWLWDDRCAECHGHSAEFARDFLKADGDRLTGPHHRDDLRLFLRNHYLSANDVDAVYAMLLAQLKTPPRYQTECLSCHGNAAQLVRSAIDLEGDKLVSRKSGQALVDFLPGHRGLSQADAEFFSALLQRISHEVYRP